MRRDKSNGKRITYIFHLKNEPYRAEQILEIEDRCGKRWNKCNYPGPGG